MLKVIMKHRKELKLEQYFYFVVMFTIISFITILLFFLLSLICSDSADLSSSVKSIVKVTTTTTDQATEKAKSKTFFSSPAAFVLNLLRKVDSTPIIALLGSTIGYNLALVKAGKDLQFRPLTKLARLFLFFTPTTRDTIFPLIVLPPELKWSQANDELVYTTGTSSLGILYFSMISKPALSRILGKPKRLTDGKINYNVFNELFDVFTNDDCFNRVGNEFLPKDYNYFGIYDGVRTLEAFMKYNPYFGAAMKAKVSPLGLLTGFIVDPYDDTTLFSSLVADLTDDVPRVVVHFDTQLRVTELKVYLGRTFETRTEVSQMYYTSLSEDDKAYMALYQMIFYGQSIHASTHLFHQLLTSSLSRATETVSPEIHAWAKVYNVNIGLKYKEVEVLLYNRGGLFNSEVSDRVSGFSTTPYENVLQKAAQMNHLWSHCHTAEEYVYGFLFKDINRKYLDQVGISVEFRNQIALSKGFSSELIVELKKLQGFNLANKQFVELCSETGHLGVNGVTSIHQFIELMTASSILHGTTLSMTRLSMTPAIMSLINYKNSRYSRGDIKLLALLGGTMSGTLEGYTVYSSKLPYKARVPYGIINVLKRYEGLSGKLKVDFYNKITKADQSTYFRDFGWIMTDHAPEGIDGKQYTFSTYI